MSDSTKQAGRWQVILAVAHRDLLEFVRDRRTLFVTFLMPMAMYPILALASTLGLRTALSDLDARQTPLPLALVLSGPDAPLVAERIAAVFDKADNPGPDWPASVTVTIMPPGEAIQLLEAGRIDGWIALPPQGGGLLDGQETLPLEARLAAVQPPDARPRQHLVALVKAVAEDARRRRIMAAGLPESVLEPVELVFPNDATEPAAASMEGVVPTAVAAVLVLLALLTATGGFYPAIDAIAGEKERGTIETLLIVPASTGDIVMGKFLAVFAVTLASLAVNAVSVLLTAAVLLRLLPAGFDLGIDAGGAAACALITLVAFCGLAAVAAAACLAVTSAARSTKEAQNTLTPVILLASGLAGFAVVPGVGGPLVAMLPFAGQVAVARQALSGGSGGALAGLLALSLVSSGVFSWLLLRAAATALADEELLFRGPDSAGGLLSRPAPRPLPTPMQGFAAALVAFATLWYVQGIAPADPALSLPLLQAALLIPLAALVAWQRVDRRDTFRLVWPGGAGRSILGSVLVGGGLFVIGAALMLTIRGTDISPAARNLAERLVPLVFEQPWWVGWLVVVILPAVCEELFFRGWVLAAFAGASPRRGRAVAAVLLQAAAFAAFHLLPERMPQTFVLGVVLGWITLTTGSLVPAILAHAAHNAVPLVLLALVADGRDPLLLADGLPGWGVAVAVAALSGGVWLITNAATVSKPEA